MVHLYCVFEITISFLMQISRPLIDFKNFPIIPLHRHALYCPVYGVLLQKGHAVHGPCDEAITISLLGLVEYSCAAESPLNDNECCKLLKFE